MSTRYGPLLERFRSQPVRLLEIGVFHGESLKAWREAFPHAEAVVGVDINPNCIRYHCPEQKIHVWIMKMVC